MTCGSSSASKDDHLSGSYQVKMPSSSRAVVHWGGATFALRFVAPSDPLGRARFSSCASSPIEASAASHPQDAGISLLQLHLEKLD